jgi:hypothetical protein
MRRQQFQSVESQREMPLSPCRAAALPYDSLSVSRPAHLGSEQLSDSLGGVRGSVCERSACGRCFRVSVSYSGT